LLFVFCIIQPINCLIGAHNCIAIKVPSEERSIIL